MANEELAEVWRERLGDLAQSGLSVRKWCEVNGYSKSQYTYWRRRLANSDTAKTGGAAWLPVQVIAPPPSPASPALLTVRVAHAAIDVEPGFDPALLRAVVHALRTLPC